VQAAENSQPTFYEVLTRATPRFFVTPALLAANVLCFAAAVALGVSPLAPEGGALLSLGANFGPLTFDGEWWRLITSAFVHIGFLHLAFNMWCLWSLGGIAERMLGNGAFFLVYVASALGGSLASLLWHPHIISAGASGAIFGIAGALGAFLYLGQIHLPQRLTRDLLGSLLFFVGFNLLFGALWVGVDNAGHLGGLLVGTLLGALLHRSLPSGRVPASRYLAIPALLVLFFGAATLARERASDDPRLLLASARETHAAGDVAAAREQLERVVELDPGFAEGYLELGELRLEEKRYDEAAALFQRAADLDPGLYAPQRGLGIALALAGRREEAIEALRIARKMEPKDVSMYVVASSLLVEANRAEEAVAVLQEALTWAPESPEVWSAMGLARLRRGELTEAVSALERAAKAEPEVAEHHNRLSLALARAGEGERALESIEKALELTPGLPHLLDSLGTVRFYRGEIEEAVAAYAEAAALAPDQAVYRYNLSVALTRLGRSGDAEAARSEALRLDPDLAVPPAGEPIL
jgi:rhomboid protease GluP